jgi:hypothetical protein
MTQRHLLYCWELGQGYGHVLNFRRLAVKLLQQGWKVSCIVNNVATARRMLAEISVIEPAPRVQNRLRFNPTRNLAEILYNNGFHDGVELKHRVGLWQQQMQKFQPDIVLLDHAPTALIAAQLEGLPHAILGTGFFLPPDVSPLPDLQADTNPASDAEVTLLTMINPMMTQAGLPEFSRFSQLFYQAKEHFLCTFAEFDHYAQRENADYWGSAFDIEQGVHSHWPAGATQRIFAYLHGDYPDIQLLLSELNQLDASVLVHVGGQHQLKPEQFPRLIWSHQPVKMTDVADQADLVICHAGHGTLSAMLLAGRPLLLLPKQLEQLVLSIRLCQQHLAYFIPPGGNLTLIPTVINKIQQDHRLQTSIVNLQQKYLGFDLKEQAQGMLDALAELFIGDEAN